MIRINALRSMKTQAYVKSQASTSISSRLLILIMTLSVCFSLIACGYRLNSRGHHQSASLPRTEIKIQNLTPYPELSLIVDRAWTHHTRTERLISSRCPHPMISLEFSKQSFTWGSPHPISSGRGAQARMLGIYLICDHQLKGKEQTLFLISLDGHYADTDSLTLNVDQSISRLISKLD